MKMKGLFHLLVPFTIPIRMKKNSTEMRMEAIGKKISHSDEKKKDRQNVEKKEN